MTGRTKRDTDQPSTCYLGSVGLYIITTISNKGAKGQGRSNINFVLLWWFSFYLTALFESLSVATDAEVCCPSRCGRRELNSGYS